MKNNSDFIFKGTLAFFGIVGCALGLLFGFKTNVLKLFRANPATYTLTLDTQKISTATSSYSGELDATVRTSLNNNTSSTCIIII